MDFFDLGDAEPGSWAVSWGPRGPQEAIQASWVALGASLGFLGGFEEPFKTSWMAHGGLLSTSRTIQDTENRPIIDKKIVPESFQNQPQTCLDICLET